VPDRFGPIARVYDLVEWGFAFYRRNPRVAIAQSLPGGHREILDLGTGTGAVLRTLVRTHCEARVTGLDASPGMLAQAQKKLDRLARKRVACADTRLVCASAADLPFGDASFDAVTASLFFHELPPEVRAKAFDEAFRVLAPGGTMAVLDLDRRPPGWKRPLQWALDAMEESYAWGLAGDGLRRELESRGLRDVLVDRDMAFVQLARGRKAT
jgi:demethylmenaquinone methyltransferase/2-methoxy-6-polyprenyl-1,4-benzoquinol methylase